MTLIIFFELFLRSSKLNLAETLLRWLLRTVGFVLTPSTLISIFQPVPSVDIGFILASVLASTRRAGQREVWKIKKKWTCHVCNPNKNLSKSNSGVFAPSEFVDPANATGTAADTDDDTSTVPQPEPVPQFNNAEEKMDYILSQVTMLVAQNATVLRELQRARDMAADAKRLAEVTASRVTQLEEQARLDACLITDLEYRNRALEDYSRVDNVIVHGLPHPQNEAEAFALIADVGKAIGIELSRQNISACHSLGRPQNGVGRIVCRFGKRWLRNQFQSTMNEKKITTAELENHDVPGEPRKIYVTDHLSPQTSHLYSEAKRLLAARFGGEYQQVFVRKRKVYARRFNDGPVAELRSLEHVRSLAGRREPAVNDTSTQQSNGASVLSR